MYTLPDLTGQLMKLAQENLPKFSERNKVFEVLIQFCHNNGNQHIKVVFWHPNNAMLVAYNHETHVEDLGTDFIISSKHSSAWRFNGLNFFKYISIQPKSWEILSSKVVEVEVTSADEHFSYSIIK